MALALATPPLALARPTTNVRKIRGCSLRPHLALSTQLRCNIRSPLRFVRSHGIRILRRSAVASDDADRSEEDTSDVQLAAREPMFTREQVLQCIKDEAPFLTTREAMVDRKFNYTPVLDYPVKSSAAYILYMLHMKKALPRELEKYDLKVTRTFQPDPETVIVRWKITWDWDEKPTSATGSSTYKLSREGLIVAVEDGAWEIEGEEANSNRFGASFDFAQAWRSEGTPRVAMDSVSKSMKYAAWESLKDDPNYGGQMTQDELDVLTMQMLYASFGLIGAIAVFIVVIISKLVF